MNIELLQDKYILHLIFLLNPKNRETNTPAINLLKDVLPTELNENQLFVTNNKFILYKMNDLKTMLITNFQEHLNQIDGKLKENNIGLEELYNLDENFFQNQKCQDKGAINPSLKNLNDGRFLCNAFDNYKEFTDPEMKCCVHNLKQKFKAAVNVNIATRRLDFFKKNVLSEQELNEQKEMMNSIPELQNLSKEDKDILDDFLKPLDSNSMVGGNKTNEAKGENNDLFDQEEIEAILYRNLKNITNLGLTDEDLQQLLKPFNMKKIFYGGQRLLKKTDGSHEIVDDNYSLKTGEEFDEEAMYNFPQGYEGNNIEDENIPTATTAATTITPNEVKTSQDFFNVEENSEVNKNKELRKKEDEELLKKVQFAVDNALPKNATFVEKMYFTIIRKFQISVKDYLLLSSEDKSKLDLEIKEKGYISWAFMKSIYNSGKDHLIWALFCIVRNPKFMNLMLQALKTMRKKICFELNIYFGNIRIRTQADKEDEWDNLNILINEFTKWSASFFKTDGTIFQYISFFDILLKGIPFFGTFSTIFIEVIIFTSKEATNELIMSNITLNAINDFLELVNFMDCFKPITIEKNIKIGRIGAENKDDPIFQGPFGKILLMFQPSPGTPAYNSLLNNGRADGTSPLEQLEIDEAAKQVVEGKLDRNMVNFNSIPTEQGKKAAYTYLNQRIGELEDEKYEKEHSEKYDKYQEELNENRNRYDKAVRNYVDPRGIVDNIQDVNKQRKQDIRNDVIRENGNIFYNILPKEEPKGQIKPDVETTAAEKNPYPTTSVNKGNSWWSGGKPNSNHKYSRRFGNKGKNPNSYNMTKRKQYL